ncbi:MAG: hypothetical protein ACLQIB_50915 [Isosphaeraceae bacterium]
MRGVALKRNMGSGRNEPPGIDEKVEDYVRAGVRLVRIGRPAARAVQVFRADRSESWLWAGNELSGEDVIPGFRCKVEDLFPIVTRANEQSIGSRTG